MLVVSTVQKKNKQPCYIKDENGPLSCTLQTVVIVLILHEELACTGFSL